MLQLFNLDLVQDAVYISADKSQDVFLIIISGDQKTPHTAQFQYGNKCCYNFGFGGTIGIKRIQINMFAAFQLCNEFLALLPLRCFL